MTTDKPVKLTANQAALLAALVSLGGLAMSREEWVTRATRHYRQAWPDGSNPHTGPVNAQKSLLRMGLVDTIRSGSRKPTRLTESGEDLCSGRVPSFVVPPKHGGGKDQCSLIQLIERSAI